MASPNRPARLNRTLLFVVAVVLLAAAAFVLLTASGVLRVVDRGAALTPATVDPPSWAPWVTIVVAVVLGLLALRWLLAQTQRRAKTGTWRLDTSEAGTTTRLDARTAVGPLVDEVESYDGVHRASARLAGTSARPTLYLDVGTEDAADVTALRHRIDTEAVPRLCRALDLDRLPAEVLIRMDDARSARLV
jgi:membrane protein implicated in regulation of membrane protease activity